MLGRYAYGNTREYALNEDGEYDEGEKYGVRDYRGGWWRLDQQVVRAFVGRWFADHTLVFGAEIRDDHRQSFGRRFLSPGGEVTYRDEAELSRRTFSLYVADDFRLNERWTLNLGMRYDDSDDLDGNLSPRAALIWQQDSSTIWKASYSEAFKMPNANDRWISDDEAVPEYVAATELVVQRQLAPQTRFTGSVYRYRRRDVFIDGGRSGSRGDQPRPRSRGRDRTPVGARGACARQPGLAALARRAWARCDQFARPARQAQLHLSAAGRGVACRLRGAVPRSPPHACTT